MLATRVSVALGLALVVASCAGEPPPSFQAAGVDIPEGAFNALADPERQALIDLVTFGAAVSREEIETVIAPLVERGADASLVRSLPYALGAQSLALDETRLRSAYTANPDWELRVRHVVRLVEPNAPNEERERARATAQQVAERARQGEGFATLAAEFSEEPGAAERGGLLEPGRRGSWVEPFWNAAVALAPGETSAVVETEYGYHVLRLEDRRPVPFEQVSRRTLLERFVPAETASGAMAEWAYSSGAILIHPPALAAARSQLLAGRPPGDTLVVAVGAGSQYTGGDLIAGWAGLASEERQLLERGDEAAFANWVEADARTVLWADAARRLGLKPDPADVEESAASWQATVALWARQLGLSSGMEAAEIYEAARLGTLSGSAEHRTLRQQLRSWRPLLRKAYPVALPDG